MAEVAGKVFDMKINQAAFKENISKMPGNLIVDTNPDTYKTAAIDFISMATGKISQKHFKEKYNKLDIPVSMLNIVIDQTHLSGGGSKEGTVISGPDATKFVQQSVVNSLALGIAQANYPIIDREKSADMAKLYSKATTPKLRSQAIEKYEQLGQAFLFSDKENETTTKPELFINEYVRQKIATGEMPQSSRISMDIASINNPSTTQDNKRVADIYLKHIKQPKGYAALIKDNPDLSPAVASFIDAVKSVDSMRIQDEKKALLLDRLVNRNAKIIEGLGPKEFPLEYITHADILIKQLNTEINLDLAAYFNANVDNLKERGEAVADPRYLILKNAYSQYDDQARHNPENKVSLKENITQEIMNEGPESFNPLMLDVLNLDNMFHGYER